MKCSTKKASLRAIPGAVVGERKAAHGEACRDHNGAQAARGGARLGAPAMMLASFSNEGCRCGSLHSNRRMTAAPGFNARGVSLLGGVRVHGLIAPAVYPLHGLMPCGEPSGSPLPIARSANPHGVALPWQGRAAFGKQAIGAGHD